MGKIIHVDDQNKIENFLCKSIDLCWRMAVQDPPVYVDTNLSVRDSPLNKNLFKPYTSNGQFIDFVVWPTLYLQQGGSVLCKGIAQGKNYKTPNQDYDNVEIKPGENVKILSSERDKDRKSATADTSENTVKENATRKSHPKGSGTVVFARSRASTSLQRSRGNVSNDATATEGVNESASRSKIADVSVKNVESQPVVNKARPVINKAGPVVNKAEMIAVEKVEERSSTTTRMNKSLNENISNSDVKSQSHSTGTMNLAQWQAQQINRKFKTVIDIKYY